MYHQNHKIKYKPTIIHDTCYIRQIHAPRVTYSPVGLPFIGFDASAFSTHDTVQYMCIAPALVRSGPMLHGCTISDLQYTCTHIKRQHMTYIKVRHIAMYKQIAPGRKIRAYYACLCLSCKVIVVLYTILIIYDLPLPGAQFYPITHADHKCITLYYENLHDCTHDQIVTDLVRV